MNILLLGSGGREHALAWSIARSSRLSHLFIAPGNPGMELYGTCLPQLSVLDFAGIAEVIRREQIGLLVVGPEVPLVEGLVDYLRYDAGLKELLIVGPDARGAQMEGSKDFSKAFMLRHGIPTARYQTFELGAYEEACAFLRTFEASISRMMRQISWPPYSTWRSLTGEKSRLACSSSRFLRSRSFQAGSH